MSLQTSQPYSSTQQSNSQKGGRYHPYTGTKCDIVSKEKSTITINGTKYKDTGGGFLLEEEIERAEIPVTIIEDALLQESDRPTCKNCDKTFACSWLLDKFDYAVCDSCKDPEVHKLITKTEAVKEYLLKDCDLERREPPLKFIKKKNPHNSHWGDMKLYLQIQVEERALEVWGSKERLEEELEKREEKKVVAKAKKYNKQMKELRMNVRSSLYNRTTAATHQHEFGEETYNDDEDNYTRVCTTCGYEETFEKM